MADLRATFFDADDESAMNVLDELLSFKGGAPAGQAVPASPHAAGPGSFTWGALRAALHASRRAGSKKIVCCFAGVLVGVLLDCPLFFSPAFWIGVRAS